MPSEVINQPSISIIAGAQERPQGASPWITPSDPKEDLDNWEFETAHDVISLE